MRYPLKVEVAEKLGEEISDAASIVPESGDESAPKKRRFGNTLGLTKESHPKLANRLPREKGAIVAPAGDGLSPFERARKLLGSRLVDKKQFYTLDGRPSNTDAIMDAAVVVARKILRGRVPENSIKLDGRPSTIGAIMEAAEEFKWAIVVLDERISLTSTKCFLDTKEVTQQKIVATAYKFLSDQRKAELLLRKKSKSL